MNILQINSVCGRGSTGRIATGIADILRNAGHTCRIAYGRDTVPDRYQDIALRIGSQRDVQIHGVMSRLFDAHGLYSTAATRRLLQTIDDIRPDLIHLHNIHGYYLNVPMLFAYIKAHRLPVVWTLHDCWPMTGHCAYFTATGCDQWKTGCTGTCPQKRVYPKCVGFSRAARNFRVKQQAFSGVEQLTFVTPSRWLADIVKDSHLGRYPVRTIPNGIDLAVFQPIRSDIKDRLGLNGERVILGVANVWDRRKGLDDFVALAGMLKAPWHIVLVGLTPAQIKALPPRIMGMTRTNSPTELAKLYTMADVFVNPTHEDNFPTTNLEALACGIPVITYRTGGSPEAVDANTGLVIGQNPRHILDALGAMNFSSEQCQQRALLFDQQTCFTQYCDLYMQILQGTRHA